MELASVFLLVANRHRKHRKIRSTKRTDARIAMASLLPLVICTIGVEGTTTGGVTIGTITGTTGSGSEGKHVELK